MKFEKIGYWDADLATPLQSINDFIPVLDNNNNAVVLVMGARIKLLGRNIQRQALRHYLGRLFASCASLVLGMPVYDTQCGAKLFRNSEEIAYAFSRPFSVNWTFDVEILARLKSLRRLNKKNNIESSIVEYPLQAWFHMSGSKVRPSDFFIAIGELIRIYRYLNSNRKDFDG
jgi:hypothetical protein